MSNELEYKQAIDQAKINLADAKERGVDAMGDSWNEVRKELRKGREEMQKIYVVHYFNVDNLGIEVAFKNHDDAKAYVKANSVDDIEGDEPYVITECELIQGAIDNETNQPRTK